MVSLFGRQPSSASYGQLGAEVQRGVHMAGRRDRALGLVGGVLRRLSRWGRLLVGTTWSRGVAVGVAG